MSDSAGDEPNSRPRDGHLSKEYDYAEAFSRNIGWITEWEQQTLRSKRIAIAGMGGVGGAHLLALARLGVGAFHIADLDDFELANFNRQVGAGMATLGEEKVGVMARMAWDINPELDLTLFPEGVTEDNIDVFLDGADLFVDGFDFFVIDMRRKVFARCAERGIPAITAAPIGFGAAWLVFQPGGMTFEEYFRLDGLTPERQCVNLAVGLAPRGLHRPSMVDALRFDFAGRRTPSTGAGVQLCAGIVATEAAKILTGRGRVRAAPWSQQFDPNRGGWARCWCPVGNAGPIQSLKRRIGYRAFDRLSRDVRPAEEPAGTTEIERILDLARWAPSGDNAQPWRFEIAGDDRVVVRLHIDGEARNIYDYNDGQPTLLSGGFLLASIRIAASRFGRAARWQYLGRDGDDHLIAVDLPPDGVMPDPLSDWIRVRSVDRRPYRTTPVSEAQKAALASSLDPALEIRWYETAAERRRLARVNAAATDIRLRLRPAWEVHRRILDWDRRFSTDGVPVTALGLDALTIGLMRRVMRSWQRVDLMNRYLAGTAMPRLQFDLVPGRRCAAHFTVGWKSLPSAEERVGSLLTAGESLQRFWLTATRMGLALQPSLAPLCFAHHAATGQEFGEPRRMRRLAEEVDRLGGANKLVFTGRVGTPVPGGLPARSVRKPVSALVVAPAREAGERVAGTGRS